MVMHYHAAPALAGRFVRLSRYRVLETLDGWQLHQIGRAMTQSMHTAPYCQTPRHRRPNERERDVPNSDHSSWQSFLVSWAIKSSMAAAGSSERDTLLSLKRACANGDILILRHLLRWELDGLAGVVFVCGMSPLHVAVSGRPRLPFVECLLANGCSPSSTDAVRIMCMCTPALAAGTFPIAETVLVLDWQIPFRRTDALRTRFAGGLHQDANPDMMHLMAPAGGADVSSGAGQAILARRSRQ